LSKHRNKHLQTTLIEAAKMAPRNSPELRHPSIRTLWLSDFQEKQTGLTPAFSWKELALPRAASLCQHGNAMLYRILR
jgi:hypothetical protein